MNKSVVSLTPSEWIFIYRSWVVLIEGVSLTGQWEESKCKDEGMADNWLGPIGLQRIYTGKFSFCASWSKRIHCSFLCPKA
jgi:hypothetical protein